MKRKLYIIFLSVPLIIALTFFLLGAHSGKQVNGINVNSAPQYSEQGRNDQPSIVPGIVMVKIKSRDVAQSLAKATTMTGLPSLDVTLSQLGATSVKKAFRHKPIPFNSSIPDISRILKVQIPEHLSPLMVARELAGDPNVEYAEPVYEGQLCAVPNDPIYSQQHHLPQIQAPEAWDVQKGDSTVTIAIVDVGFDYHHEDLADNVWTNELEANGVAGVDDDGNGFVDDIHGWDFGDDDSDPNFPSTDYLAYGHGTACAGLACAVTDNGIGIAGVSWNCRFMPIKGLADDGQFLFTNFWEGIIYAADNGADVISNSWGGWGYLQWAQDVVNYAYSKGAIVVCAAGNYDVDWPFYPASYQHVVSVAAVNRSDQKASYSSFGPWVDICAPGGDWDGGLLSTIPGNKYNSDASGTSFSTPVAAAVFGMVKAQHPEWTNDQIVRQVLVTADNIDGRNPQYANRLGHGRVNAFRALTINPNDLPEPDARLAILSIQLDESLYGNGDGIFERGETIQLDLVIKNWSIGATNAATVQLICANFDVQISDGTVGPMFFPADTMLPFAFTFKVADQAIAKKTEFVLSMTTNKGYAREESIQIAIGKMPILLVDNDHNDITSYFPDVNSFYQNILQQKKLLYGYLNALHSGFLETTFPKATTLSKFPIVVVMASSPCVSNSNLPKFVLGMEACDALREYVAGGGHLFVCGQDVGAYAFESLGTDESKAFMRDYLHAEYLANDSQNRSIRGVANDPISKNLSFHIWQPLLYEEWQWPDVIAPTAGASTIFTYSNGRTAAVKYAGDYKVVYFGFGGLEAVDSDANTQIGNLSSIRTELFIRILNWLNFIEHEPLTMTEETTKPRAITVKISRNVTDLQTATLFWRLQGETDFTAVPMTKTDTRSYSADILGPGAPATIEYFIQTSHPYYNWQSPVDAPDNVYSYYAGPDTVHPRISRISKLTNRLGTWQPCPVSAVAADNLGIDTSGVFAHYHVLNRSLKDSVMLTPTGALDNYAGELPLVFAPGDTVEYRVTAKDRSLSGNIAGSPWQKFIVGYEDFENDLTGWQLDPLGWGLYPMGYTGNNSICSSPQGFYEMGLDVSLTSKYGVDLSQTDKAVLTFWTAYFIEENSDFGYIEVSNDSAATWQRLGPVFTGTKSDWEAVSISLCAFTGDGFDDVRIRFRFISDSTQSQGMVGWYIDDIQVISGIEVGITNPSEKIALPQSFALYQNYPNPFNPSTTIEFALPKSAFVTLKVYNLLGEEVATLIAEQRLAGINKVNWDARGLASGVYLYRLEAGEFVQTKKLILMR